MFRGFRFQVALPVAGLALLLAVVGAVGFAAWAVKHEESSVNQQVGERVAAIRGVFVTTAALMQDRAHASMSLLKNQISIRGDVERGAAVTVGPETVADLQFGGKAQANNFEIVDYVTRFNGGTATIFSKDGDRFVRIATNVKKDDGSRAVGTLLNATTRAYAELIKGQPFYGVVDILGNPFFTGYEPLYSSKGDYVGVSYVGYKAELPVLSSALDQSRLLQTGFVAVVDGDNAVRYAPGWLTKEQAARRIANGDGRWVVHREPLPEWGLTIVSAYPTAELRSTGLKIGYSVLLAGVILGGIIAIALFVLLDRTVLQLLGGEPRDAAEHMKQIASGNLAVEIALRGSREDSLMASLMMMQLKLKNLVTAVRGGAAEVAAQSRAFEAAAAMFQSGRDEKSALELLKQTKGVSRTLSVLEKAVARFRV